VATLRDITIRNTLCTTLACTGVASPGIGFYIDCGTIASIERAEITGTTEPLHQTTAGGSMSSDFPRVQLSDIIVQGGDDAFYIDAGTLVLNRASVAGITGRGMALAGGARGAVEDLDVTGAANGQTTTASCLFMRDTMTVGSMKRFSCRGEYIGVYLFIDGIAVQLQDGVIAGSTFGFDVGQSQSIPDLIDGVHLENVATPIYAH
jgi:hypothetical protein